MACKICKKPLVSSENATLLSDSKPHVCEVCGKSFSLKIQLKRHLLTHEDDNLQSICSSCERSSDENRSYNLRLSQKGNFKCESCEKSFPSQRLLLRHASKHTLENVFSCEECGDIFKTASSLKRHSTVHKPKKEVSKSNAPKKISDMCFVCDECNKSFATLSQYNRHCKTHIKHECDKCYTTFKSNKLLDNHKKSGACNSNTQKIDTLISFKLNKNNDDSSNNDEKKPTCFICNKSFARKSALEGHMLSHLVDSKESGVEDDSDYDVDFVCNGNKVEEQAKPFQLPKLKIRRPQHKCNKCEVVCTSKKFLHVHMMTHKNTTDNSNVADSNEVTDHSKIADNSKIVDSKVADSSVVVDNHNILENSNNADSSNVVEASKQVKKNYVCRFCNDTFSLKEEYKKHKLTHHPNQLEEKKESNKEQKIYTCKICNKDFSKRKHLKRHLRNHAGEGDSRDSISDSNGSLPSGKRQKRVKNFSCSYCGKLFAGKICLKKHENKHVYDDKSESSAGKSKKGKKPKVLVCDICNEEFTGKRHVFMKHKLSHTPEVCGICDKRFVDRASLREHCKIHIGTEEGRRFVECSQKALDAKNGVVPPEPKVEYIYLVLR